jgi:DNA-binding NarL/FixJ family response regulator
VLIYSRDMRPDLRARAIARGADGWVSMSTHSSGLVDAIERLADDKPLEEQVDWIGHEAGLSPREVEVLSLVTMGMSNQEIADRLFLTINTLKSHIRQAYKKIGVTSRAQAVAWCMQHGFAPPEQRSSGE